MDETGLNGITLVFVVFGITLLVVRLCQKLFQDIYHSPPGPWGFPILGHLPLLGNNPSETLMKWSQKYGNVFMIRMGSWPTLILNSRDVIREAMMDNPEIFSDRPQFFTSKSLNNMKSLVFGSYSPRWRLHNKIANHVLGQFVSSKNNRTQEIINREADVVVESFIRNYGSSFNPHDDIFISVGCIMYQICFGSAKNCRFDQNFLKFVGNNKSFTDMAGAGNPFDAMPWLRFVMPWKAKRFLALIDVNKTLVGKEIKNHLKSFDNNHQRDICDGLIALAEKYGNSPELNNGITKQEIMSSTLQDFMGAGFETVSTTLEWIILYLAYHKQVQKNVQDEIGVVIGNRKPTLEDRGKLPYTEATILEVIRIANVVPMALPHATTSDIMFHNYTIKKGTVVFCNTYATGKDSKMWENPDSFCPERYLDSNNEIDPVKANAIYTFGVGRRRCPGEFLARMELFLLVVNIFQKCDIKLCSNPDFEGIFGLTYKPQPYQIKVSETN